MTHTGVIRMNIVFVGDEPSLDNVRSDVAFVGTKSYKRLLDWIYKMDVNINNTHLINKSNLTVLNKNEFEIHPDQHTTVFMEYVDCKFVALGNNASKALEALKIDHFKLPHPSGRNRAVNNKSLVLRELQACKEFLNLSRESK